MANISSIKAVRTRYRNILDKELDSAQVIISCDLSTVDDNRFLKEINQSITLLKSYSSKLGDQMNKLLDAISDSEESLVQTIVEEDSDLTFNVEKCICELTELAKVISKEKDRDVKHPVSPESERILNLHEDMHKLMLTQLQQQQEFFEKQAKQEKLDKECVKLPKLELNSFNGDKLKWLEFWDAFECTVHANKRLSNIEKFSYLRSKLVGEAYRAVAGLALSGDNYCVAVDILKERFGKPQEIVDVHYKKLMNTPPASDKVESVKALLDSIEKHLRSLEVLGENVNQHVFVSMIRSKLPQDVIFHLELMKGASAVWTVTKLREALREYVVAREQAQTSKESKDKLSEKEIPKRPGPTFKQRYASRPASSTETLLSNATSTNKKGMLKRDHCRYCEQKHWSDECPTYKSIEERKKRLKGSCYLCLRENHRTKDCRRSKVCVYCGKQNIHHRSLCPKKFNQSLNSESVHLLEETVQGEQNSATNEVTVPEENVMISSGEIVLMQTATTEVENSKANKSEKVRILLDCGSQRTYITQNLADKLGLKAEKEETIKLVTFGRNNPTTIKTKSTTLLLKLNDGKHLRMSANIVPVISGSIQRKRIDISSNELLNQLVQSVKLADTIPDETETTSIELLIGNDYYLDLVLCQKMEIQPGLYLLGSKLGWLLTGRTSDNEMESNRTNFLILTHGKEVTKTEVFQSVDNCIPTKPDIEDFWNVESIGVTDDSAVTDDERAMDNFRETIEFQDGRYQVTWPWKEDITELPVNRDLARGRLNSLVRRMRSKPDLIKKYDSVIKEQLDQGVIEKVKTTDGVRHYIPHHAVVKPQSTTTKLRVVYDASAKSKPGNKSLNECLRRGPVMLHDLCGMLIRFRLHKVVLVADIEKAFLQIGLQRNQRDVTRFVWLKDTDNHSAEPDNIEEYRFCRVPFGVISSPFLLGATLDTHLENYDSDVASKLKGDIYVDNVITGTNDTDGALQMYTEAKSIFRDASMNLREWLSNSEVVYESIPPEDRAKETTIKVLGHLWNSILDTLTIKNPSSLFKGEKLTKRMLLKVIASVFDPMGLFAPVLLRGKLLIQELWKGHYDWDDQIDDTAISSKWSVVHADLGRLDQFPITRCIIHNSTTGSNYSLLCFCDASSRAYSAAVYLHQETNDRATVNLLFAKTRLAPVKEITIPRLELLAVLIGIRCLSFVKKQLRLPIRKQLLWTDSQCVLEWTRTSKKLLTFVANRVKEIRDHSDVAMNYVNTKKNPADIATRGSTLEDLNNNDLWWHGPHWLKESIQALISGNEVERTELSSKTPTKEQTEQLEMLLNVKDKASCETSKLCAPFGIDEERFSSVTKLLRVTAFALRFVKKLKKQSVERDYLTSAEIQEAEHLWISYIQKKNYDYVLDGIAKNKPTNLQVQLGLFLDGDNILRSRGRLENANLTEGARLPILLPPKEMFTQLIIKRVHKQYLHAGVSQTLAMVRQTFWIPRGRATVKSVIQDCTVGRRVEGGPYKMPKMPPLPKVRVSESSPFSYVGLDYLGPIYIKTVEGSRKVWICLFTCLVTRAVHLELVQDMSTEEFLLGFKRFVSTRGTPTEIISDNAAQFKAASGALGKVWHQVIHSEEVQNQISTQGIKWKFIVELAPWMGGFYERLVGVVKRSLRKTIGRKLLTLIQLQTVLKEVESVVNSRPLVYVDDDINSRLILTPCHFLTLNPNIGLPEMELDDGDSEYNPYENSGDSLLKHWKKGQKLLNAFWKSWREDYVMSLRERTQTALKSWRIQSPFCAQIGDVVLIKEDLPRGCWKIGRIIKLLPSRDTNVRAARVKISSGKILNRPLCQLYPIECPINENIESVVPDAVVSQDVVCRPTRSSAVQARLKIKGQI